MNGPTFSQPPRVNHVALSLPADALDADGRAAIAEFYGDVFGFGEYPEMTKDRQQLVLGFHTHEQFLFLIADDDPMRAPQMDHFGISVATLAEFEEVHRRAVRWTEEVPDEVHLVAPTAEEYAGVLRLHSFYVGYRLPMVVETQHFEFL